MNISTLYVVSVTFVSFKSVVEFAVLITKNH